LQFSEGGFVVFEDGVGLLEDADAIPFYGVGEGLDLVVETGGMLALLVERGIEVVWRENVEEGLTASCHLASGTLVCLRASFLSRRRKWRLCRAFWRRC
jgi:hypothetical protein